MSDEAKNIINTVNNGELPVIPLATDALTKGLQSSQRGIDKSTFGLQNLSEGLKNKGE